jgi:transcription antitermination factor NusG
MMWGLGGVICDAWVSSERMSLQSTNRECGSVPVSMPASSLPVSERQWFATFTLPQNEKSVLKQLDIRSVESFLPTYETIRIWKNRQRKMVTLPLFPTYLFVRISRAERGQVLRCPGVLHIVGNTKEPIPVPDAEVEFLRSNVCRRKVEPFRELVIGERVRIKSGVMQGLEGTLVRRSSSLRFVLTIQMINQHAAIEVDAKDMEPVTA